MATIEEVKRKIVKAIEEGRDPAPLQKELTELRAGAIAEAELVELQKVAAARQQIRDKAKAIEGRVKKQGDAIDRFLEIRNAAIGHIAELLPLMEKLSNMQSLNNDGWGECLGEFSDYQMFVSQVKDIPQGYLPAGFGCPFLGMRDGTNHFNQARVAWEMIGRGFHIINNFEKGISVFHLRPASEIEVIFPDEYAETNCMVCGHEKVTEINKALQEGVSTLRELESQYGISRSTLSRHKKNCLVIPMRQEA